MEALFPTGWFDGSNSITDPRYWAQSIMRYVAQNGYAIGLPSWETGTDGGGNEVPEAFLFPIGFACTLANATEMALLGCLYESYNLDVDNLDDHRRWAAAVHLFAKSEQAASAITQACVSSSFVWDSSIT